MREQFNYDGKGIVHPVHHMNTTSVLSFNEWYLSVAHRTKREKVTEYLKRQKSAYSSRQLWYDLKIERSTLCGILNTLKKKNQLYVTVAKCPHTGRLIEHYTLVENEKEPLQKRLF